MRKDDFFIQCATAEKMQGLLNTLKNNGYVMASDFKKEIPTAQELLTEFKKYNHGNAKMLLHLFRNSITGRKEISTGSATIYRSYPQYKNLKIIRI